MHPITFVSKIRVTTIRMENSTIRNLWYDYKSEVVFGLVLMLLTVLSYWLASYIPEQIYENYINPLEYAVTTAVCFFGAILLYSHEEQNRLRRSWAGVLIAWGCIDILAWVLRYVLHITAVGGTPADPLFNASLTLGNILAFLLFIYPTQVLRPGWLNWWRAVLFLLPMIVLGVVDYFVPANLLYVIMLYPAVIFVVLCQHIRKYRQWCEDNFSSMEDIDVQWIVRYLTMLFILGMAFYFIAFIYVPNRMFTQQWTLLLILAYTTERVLFRPDPWMTITGDSTPEAADMPWSREQGATDANAMYRKKLEAWFEQEKPYLNPDFQLMDLRRVLPMNRTYLSQFINSVYGCSFYQLVNRYRIEAAKRMLTDHPEKKMQDVAEQCGFASRQTFTRSFTRETGVNPTEWK